MNVDNQRAGGTEEKSNQEEKKKRESKVQEIIHLFVCIT